MNLFKIEHLGTAFQIKNNHIARRSLGRKTTVKNNNLCRTHKAGYLSFLYLVMVMETIPIFHKIFSILLQHHGIKDSKCHQT